MTFGVYSIADAIQSFFEANKLNPLFQNITLETADDDQVKLAIHYVLSDPNSASLADLFSQKAIHEPGMILGQSAEIWTSPAIMFPVNINNSKIPKEESTGLAAGTAGGVEHQKINRKVQDLLRGDEKSYRLWGIAIDLDLESEEEGLLSFPLIVAAIVLIIIIVTIQFKSGKVAVLTILGLFMLIIWLKGFSNLLGLKSSLTLDIILPVAILVLGVDYVIHAVHRYREESKSESDPRGALANSVAGVGGALTLAMLTTVVAFMSNICSGIEDTRGFGIAATVAIISAFIIMGLFVPTLKMHWDAWRVKRMKKGTSHNNPAEKLDRSFKQIDKNDDRKSKHHGTLLSRTVCHVADKKAITLVLMVILTIIAGFYAFKLETKMDAKEFLDTNSDFVISLDKLDEHIGEAGGEPATILIKGDLSSPESLDAIQKFIQNMADDKTIARRINDSQVLVDARIFDFIDEVLQSNVTKTRIEINTGISIPDVKDYSSLDQEQLRAIFNYIVVHGIALNETALSYEPSRIKEGFYHAPSSSDEDATIVQVFIPGTREQSIVRDSKNEILDDMEALEDVDSISSTGLTGPGYERLATLDAITDTLTTSIIIAVILCFIILLIAFRSLRYALVTIIPVMLVAVWLYAIMYLTGFHLNMVRRERKYPIRWQLWKKQLEDPEQHSSARQCQHFSVF
jgi:predicted RND superfamily exporter protein